MKDPRLDYVQVGGFVLAMIVAFVVCMAVLSGRTGASDDYYTHFDNVLGVVPGTKVFFEGYEVGRVAAIEPEPDPARKRYRVTLAIDEGWPIPEGSVAHVTEPSLLAAITIDIHAGPGDAPLPPGSTIAGRDLASVFTVAATLAEEAARILEEDLRPLIEAVSTGTPQVLANLESATADLAAVSRQVTAIFDAETTDQIDGMIDDLAGTARNLGELSQALESSLERLDGMVGNVDALVSGNTDEMEQIVEDLAHTLEAVARRVDTIAANLESTSHNVNEFSRQIRQNPGVLVRGTSGGDDAP